MWLLPSLVTATEQWRGTQLSHNLCSSFQVSAASLLRRVWISFTKIQNEKGKMYTCSTCTVHVILHQSCCNNIFLDQTFTFPSTYTCVTCGTRYCCVRCLGTHLDTRWTFVQHFLSWYRPLNTAWRSIPYCMKILQMHEVDCLNSWSTLWCQNRKHYFCIL